MSRLKIFMTGGSGLLGQYLNLELSNRFDVLTQYNINEGNCRQFNSIKLELTNYDVLEKIFEDFKPDIVIHTAAIASPQLSEQLPTKQVYNVNVLSTEKIAQLCDKLNSNLIYTSTDLVYAGYRDKMLDEDAKLVPVSLYAETKLMGEEKIRSTFENFLILRTALLYGFGLNHSKSHFQEMYESLKSNKEVKLFTDQFRTPLSLKEAARIISFLCTLDIKSEIINFGGKERVSRFELGEALCKSAGFNRDLLIKSKMSSINNFPAVADVSMNTSKLQSLGINLKTINESIEEILKVDV